MIIEGFEFKTSRYQFVEKKFPLADSKGAHCQLLVEEWALNTGKVPLEACTGIVWLSN